LPPKHDRILVRLDREEAFDAQLHSGRGDERKLLDEVFDERTLKALHKLMNEGLFQILDFPIATGKEASVFVAVGKKGEEYAVKIYRVANATFNSIRRYIEDDPRFRLVGHDKRSVIYTWAMKEFKNLTRMHRAGVHVPKALRYYENILVMEYLGVGENHDPAPPLRNATGYDPEVVFEQIKQDVRKIVAGSRLVHGDIRSDNVCFVDSQVIFVDWSHAARGNRFLDLATVLPTLYLEGGPDPYHVMPDGGSRASLGSAIHIKRTIEDHSMPQWLKIVFKKLIAIELEWAACCLGLDKPDGLQWRTI